MNSTIAQLRIIALLEGISFLVLLGICMPLKYQWGYPQPTKVVGMIHGILFLAYIYWTFMAASKYKWSKPIIAWTLLAAVLPFGTFVADKKIFKSVKL